MIQQFRSNRFAVTMAVDAAAWLVGYVIFTWLRFDGMATDAPWSAVGLVAFGTIGLYLVAGIALQLFQGRARVASLDEMLLLGTAIGAVGGVVALANLVRPLGSAQHSRRGLACWRWCSRPGPARPGAGSRNGTRSVSPTDCDSQRILIVGAGQAGDELIRSMLRDPLAVLAACRTARRRPAQAAPPAQGCAGRGHHRTDVGAG